MSRQLEEKGLPAFVVVVVVVVVEKLSLRLREVLEKEDDDSNADVDDKGECDEEEVNEFNKIEGRTLS